MSSDISFISGLRLTFREFYRLAGKNGTIDRTAEEMDMHAKFRGVEMELQKKAWKKRGDYKLSESYSYADYLRFRCRFMGDCASDLAIANAKLKFKNEPSFNDNGDPSSGTLDGGQVYEGIRQDNGKNIKLKGGTTVFFSRDGRIRMATLAEDASIKGLNCKAGTEIEFYEIRRIRRYTPSKNINIILEDEEKKTKPDIILAGFEVTYYENGRIKSYVSAKTRKIVSLEGNGDQL